VQDDAGGGDDGRPRAVLTVEDVAVRLSLHPDTVRRLLREGRLMDHLINRRAGGAFASPGVSRS
jgi:hypothetical protein